MEARQVFVDADVSAARRGGLWSCRRGQQSVRVGLTLTLMSHMLTQHTSDDILLLSLLFATNRSLKQEGTFCAHPLPVHFPYFVVTIAA